MTEYTVTNQFEQGKTVWFVLRNGEEFVSRHQSAETAWNSAEAKAHAEAKRTGKRAVYTAAEMITENHEDNGPRSCWKVA